MALRTPLTAQPHLYIGDSTGRPLDYGRVYFGEPNKDPEFYPIDIYLDPEMTIAAAQPVRTKGGFMDVGGNLAELHAAEVVYSLKVLDQYGRQVFYKPEMHRNNVSDFLVDEITRATAAETLIAGNLTAETQRAVAAEKVIADAVVTEKDRAVAAESLLDGKYTTLSTTISSIGGGKKAYTTYAKMEAAAALPVGDPLKLPANSSVDVTNDTDTNKNGTYAYDGATFTKSPYDPLNLAKTYTDSSINNINNRVTRFVSGDENNPKPYIEQTRNTGSKIYVKVARIYITATATFNGAYYTWDNIKTDINNPTLFVTSEIGTPDCLVLKDQSLVFDYTDSKFKVITRNLVDSSKHLNLVTGTLGKAVSGKLKDQWLNLRNDDIASTSFYMDVGEQVGSTPYVEQAVVGNVPYRVLYLKIDNIRLRGRGVNAAKTWANIIADINRPDLIVTSQKGEPNCLKLSDQILVYNLETKKFAVRDTSIADKYNEIVFANVTFGQLLDGIIFDWWMNKRVNKLELSGGSGSDAAVASTLPAPSPQTRLLAHGGFHGNNQLAPFNTLPAFVLAGRYGFWGIETDLVETKDGEWVLSHDLTLDAYTNGTGLVKDYTLAELKLLDASKYANASGWVDVPICTLDECLEVCVQYNLTPVLEFKSVPTKTGVEKVINTIKKYMPITNAILTSTFDIAPLNTIRTVSAEMPIMLNVGAITAEHILSAKGLGNCVLSGQRTKNTDALYLQTRNAGLQAATWTLTQTEIDKGLTSGCQYATTDHGVTANFDKGLITYSFVNDSTYSNMTSIGAGTAANKVLTIPSGQAYIEIAVKKGDVITTSFLARSGAAASSVAIECITGVDTVHRNYSENAVTSGTFKAHALSAVVYDNVTKVRLTFKAGTNGMAVRDIKIDKREV